MISTKPPKQRRTGPLAVTGNTLEQHDRWRQQFNPLRGLTVTRAVALLESAQRGEFADLQWTYRFIERRDEDLIALLERRTGALLQMDWDIRLMDPKHADRRGLRYDQSLAEDQAAVLRAAYDRIGNLYEAIEHLALATFREFSLCQLQAGDSAALPGEATRLECLNHWNLLRDGLTGPWYWNPAAKQATVASLGPEALIDPNYCLIRQWPRPLDEIALLKFIYSNLSRKNWNAFTEIYGIPAWVVIMPPTVPQGREAEYLATARSVTEGQPGALPPGSDLKCADQPRGLNPFRDHLTYFTEKLVLAGTGGLLTMLAQSGSGTLAGAAHMEAFKIVARAEARKISECFQRQFDAKLLADRFPGKPICAWFELAANEEQDIGDILDHCVKINQAGGQPDWTQISEKTGYTITQAQKPIPVNPTKNAEGSGPQSILNRSGSSPRLSLIETAINTALEDRAQLLQPWLNRLAALDQAGLTDAEFLVAVQTMTADLGDLLTPDAIEALTAPLETAIAKTLNPAGSES